MTSNRLRAFLITLLMVAAAVAAYALKPTQHLSDMGSKLELEAVFPQRFGDWEVDNRMPVQLVSPDTEALLNKIYNQTLSRTYVNSKGERIMLSAAYGGDQSDGTRAHRPEVCYPAQGFQVTSSRDTVIQGPAVTVPARLLMAKLGGREEPITYWVVVGDRIALSGTDQKLAQLRYGLRGVIPDGMLIRVSSIDRDMKRGHQLQAAFISDLASALPADKRSKLFGTQLRQPA